MHFISTDAGNVGATRALDLKVAAAQCYRSQIQVADADQAPLLPSFVVRRLLAVREVAF